MSPDPPPKRPSLNEFDYFDEGEVYQEKLAEVGPGSSLDDQLEDFHRQRRRYGRSFTLMMATLAVVVWALSGWAEEIEYDFFVSPTPIEMGEASEHRADDYAHNSFVDLRGITLQSGMQQKRIRGIALMRQQYWLFRLSGSQGVFIETPDDRSRFDLVSHVHVQGRVVDPKRDESYAQILDSFYAQSTSKRRPSLRIIQVDRQPGATRIGFVLGGGFVLLLLASNIFVLRRLLRAHRKLTGMQVVRA